MNFQDIIIRVAVVFAGVLLASGASWLLIRDELYKYLHRTPAQPPSNAGNTILPMRLQAHERLIVFVERINPVNLLLRLHQQGIAVQELQAGILNEIRLEYQHNIGQQLYISKIAWEMIRKLKEDTIAMINNVVQNLPDDATGVDVSRKILQHMTSIEENPYDLAIDMLKADIHKLF